MMRIGVFDSGIGGVNVLASLIKKYPNNEYIFYGDTKNLPYGDKTKEELFHLACNAIDFLINKKVEIIIIACGTISSTCYQTLKKKYDIPLYDIISPTIRYLKTSDYQNIGVIGTKRTIESKIFDIKKKNILMHATPSFVPIIENGEIENKQDEIVNELKIFKDYDCLVLGCTHYPLLKELIDSNLHLQTIDMGECLTDEIKLNNIGSSKIELYFSLVSVNLIVNVDKIIIPKHEIYAI